MNKDEAEKALMDIFKGLVEEQRQQEKLLRDTALAAIPESVSSIYLHVEHNRAHGGYLHLLKRRFEGRIYSSNTNYWGQLMQEKNEIETFARKADAIVHLGDKICDYCGDCRYEYGSYTINDTGYLAKRVEKPLYVGYLDDFCFRCNPPCHEIAPLREMKAKLFKIF